ncbi:MULTISPECIES: hypothetical protein [unclassified Novosphingobium]|uniref:VpaChn25_0724 family phage protein n=1 Tax=unclassified Novosphingobium TaxID=2644732 RepID=UPI000D318F21|nr:MULTISPECIES: hypothetical protein [unclassified Novosphingobium]PTR11778.1 hypothetical protein C8K11_104137 [Novosphingobium sp. GV055]PUB04818.1 hypothetical protein C8K12_104137 [Novosphingobium sp. GV061]PUB21137.1 hypothetical protein C8K14_104137 [Novosphingobium sp. GV079]PUB42863.1 hypothetical protein C8K10_104137 [Novosphingobium sp. GV027]
MADVQAADARLAILRTLAEQVDGQLNALLIRRTLDIYGIKRDDDWIETQLRKMAMLGAIELIDAGALPIARIAPAGRSHLEERAVLAGITLPSELRR